MDVRCSWSAHARIPDQRDDAIQSPGMPVPRSLHAPDTINVLRFDLTDAAGRTGNPEGERIRAGAKRGSAERERERSRRINLSDLGGEQSISRARGIM